ncbi:hypothetical protein SARC_03514 [Sphaeroforma arctica JP610]|uniref:C2H2-type domain-containing protein n=1 Tax=Sphaeroforma arctica JP610 TaxID=667725 RepID=A0A0L0G5Z4_9EUKA|nr:hypothetical protein SARC_03514 [Sphaeroforma arctica JP610]KNC84266.1 hypothetical protein SARC_03514 [Sphaeroforma arctica JP610]|eukprot:XP_014158168.1 hypothetical protein SARC_03514 [Sphaeroforma arctica JP610]
MSPGMPDSSNFLTSVGMGANQTAKSTQQQQYRSTDAIMRGTMSNPDFQGNRDKTPLTSSSLSETSTVHGRPYSLVEGPNNPLFFNTPMSMNQNLNQVLGQNPSHNQTLAQGLNSGLNLGMPSFTPSQQTQQIAQQHFQQSVQLQTNLMSQQPQPQQHSPQAVPIGQPQSAQQLQHQPNSPLNSLKWGLNSPSPELQRSFTPGQLAMHAQPMRLMQSMSMGSFDRANMRGNTNPLWQIQAVPAQFNRQDMKKAAMRPRNTPIPIKSKVSADGTTGVEKPAEDAHRKVRKRRGFKELVRNITCAYNGCLRVYATESSLQTHIRIKHNNIRPQGYEKPVKNKEAKRTVSTSVLLTAKNTDTAQVSNTENPSDEAVKSSAEQSERTADLVQSNENYNLNQQTKTAETEKGTMQKKTADIKDKEHDTNMSSIAEATDGELFSMDQHVSNILSVSEMPSLKSVQSDITNYHSSMLHSTNTGGASSTTTPSPNLDRKLSSSSLMLNMKLSDLHLDAETQANMLVNSIPENVELNIPSPHDMMSALDFAQDDKFQDLTRRHSMVTLSNAPMWELEDHSTAFANMFNAPAHQSLSSASATQANSTSLAMALDGIPEISSPEFLLGDSHLTDTRGLDLMVDETFDFDDMNFLNQGSLLLGDMSTLLNYS